MRKEKEKKMKEKEREENEREREENEREREMHYIPDEGGDEEIREVERSSPSTGLETQGRRREKKQKERERERKRKREEEETERKRKREEEETGSLFIPSVSSYFFIPSLHPFSFQWNLMKERKGKK